MILLKELPDGLRLNGRVPVTVHIIEDDPAVRDAAREVVTGAGQEALVYAGPAEFFTSASVGPRDIVVLDLHFPVGSGIEIATRLRSEHPGVRIIVVSGIRLARYSQALAAIAPAASFRKPLDAAAFAECVNRLAAK